MKSSEPLQSSGELQGSTKDAFAELDAHFHTLVHDKKLANVVTLVAQHGKVIHRDAYGVQDASASLPVAVTTTSLYRIASMIKPFVAVGMMVLWEEGLWKLEDPVSNFVPEFSDLKVKVEKEGAVELVDQQTPMTMKQLMSHTAGFGGRLEYDIKQLRSGDLQHMIDILANTPLFFQPGKEWRYGHSVDVQAYIIEKLTGQSIDEFLAECLFKPLEMIDTGYILPASKLYRLVNIHKQAGSKLLSVPLEGTYNANKPKFLGGGTTVYSTVDDYLRFSQMLLNGGELDGKRVLKSSTVKLMQTSVLEPGVQVRFGTYVLEGLGFGLGFAVVEKQVKSLKVGTYFWGGIYGTWFWIDPSNEIVVVGFVNEEDAVRRVPNLNEACAKLVYGALRDNERGSSAQSSSRKC